VIVYVSIGNSDDKLTQKEWAEFSQAVDTALGEDSGLVEGRHGAWTSHPTAEWQNACWCVVVSDKRVAELQAWLCDIAEEYRQDSIAWAEVRRTTYLEPMK